MCTCCELLFVTNSISYMLEAGRSLKLFYPNMLRVTCITQSLCKIAEKMRLLFPSINVSMKQIFLKVAHIVSELTEKLSNMLICDVTGNFSITQGIQKKLQYKLLKEIRFVHPKPRLQENRIWISVKYRIEETEHWLNVFRRTRVLCSYLQLGMAWITTRRFVITEVNTAPRGFNYKLRVNKIKIQNYQENNKHSLRKKQNITMFDP